MPTKTEISELRHKHGITQIEAAEMVAISMSSWQKYEYGTVEMPISTWQLFKVKLALLPDIKPG